MEILDQIEGRITKAVQTIEQLQARVRELEEQKGQYEEKLSSLLAHLDQFGDAPATEPEGSNQEGAAAENDVAQPAYPSEPNNAEHHHF